MPGAVDRRQVRAAPGQQRQQVRLRQGDREHRPAGGRRHQPASGDHQPQRVLERHNAREARRDILADAVADQGGGTNAERLERRGHGEFHDEQSRLGAFGLR